MQEASISFKFGLQDIRMVVVHHGYTTFLSSGFAAGQRETMYVQIVHRVSRISVSSAMLFVCFTCKLFCIVLYCIVSIYLYSASCSAHQSEVLPVRETQREESSLERTKRRTWHTS